MPYASVNGGTIYYESYGSGPAIVFAHGIGGNHLSWWQQVPHFRDRYRCIIFDHPGFGRSDDPPGEWSFVDALGGLLDQLDIADARLVAQSMGGWTCLPYALAHPERVRALVMADTPGSIELPAFADAWRQAIPADSLFARGIHPACGERMFIEQPALHFLYSEIAALNPITWSPSNRPGGMTRVSAVPRETLQTLRVPTLCIIGEEDAALPPALLELAAAATPGAQIERVPQAGHSVYFERPDRFNAAVDAFLNAHP
jgi:3-oxoadipate enol-lactonase